MPNVVVLTSQVGFAMQWYIQHNISTRELSKLGFRCEQFVDTGGAAQLETLRTNVYKSTRQVGKLAQF
jgi:hypothetical protein